MVDRLNFWDRLAISGFSGVLAFIWRLWRFLQPYLFLGFQTGQSTGISTKYDSIIVSAWLKRSQVYLTEVTIVFVDVYIWQCYSAWWKCDRSPTIRRTDGGISAISPTTTSLSVLSLIATHEQLCFGDVEILPIITLVSKPSNGRMKGQSVYGG